MTEPVTPPLDAARARLRLTLEAVGGEVTRLAPGSASLRVHFDDLVDQLDLGPEPAVRACPHCGKPGLKIATLCGFCWRRVTPAA